MSYMTQGEGEGADAGDETGDCATSDNGKDSKNTEVENIIERTPQATGATKYGDRDFLEAVKDNEPATSSDVAGAVGCSQQTAARRLQRLEEYGAVLSKKVGQAYLWILMPDHSNSNQNDSGSDSDRNRNNSC